MHGELVFACCHQVSLYSIQVEHCILFKLSITHLRDWSGTSLSLSLSLCQARWVFGPPNVNLYPDIPVMILKGNTQTKIEYKKVGCWSGSQYLCWCHLSWDTRTVEMIIKDTRSYPGIKSGGHQYNNACPKVGSSLVPYWYHLAYVMQKLSKSVVPTYYRRTIVHKIFKVTRTCPDGIRGEGGHQYHNII
jgi:hypothetical protein